MSRTSFERHMYILFTFYVQGVLSEKKNKDSFFILWRSHQQIFRAQADN